MNCLRLKSPIDLRLREKENKRERDKKITKQNKTNGGGMISGRRCWCFENTIKTYNDWNIRIQTLFSY